VRRVEPDFICKNLASAVISKKTEKQTIINVAIWRLSREDWLG